LRLFVSYSRRDAEFVDRLNRSLGESGHDVWVDRDDIAGSGEDRWRRSIVMAIKGSDAVLLVLSPQSTHSTNVERELSVAAENHKRIVPILFRPCTIPDGFQYELAGVQYVDFSSLGYREALSQLLTTLKPPGAAPTSPRPPRRPKGRVWPVIAAGIGLVVIGGVYFVIRSSGHDGVTGSGSSSSSSSPFSAVARESTTAPTEQDRAKNLVTEWATATTHRNWERVTEIDPDGLPDGGGQDYEQWYGSDPTAPHYMNSIQPYFPNLKPVEQSPGMWRVTGAVVAYDTEEGSPDGRTNFVCSTWDVDLTHEPATLDWEHRAAQQSMGRLPIGEFENMYAAQCG